MSCPSDNTQTIDQSGFWESGSLNWDAHRTIAGSRSVAVAYPFFLNSPAELLIIRRCMDCNHLFMLHVPTLPVCVPRLPLCLFST
ncbi:hypothetical protein K435DRAFT_502959 [Dendrothele bispora CBS 962.96]|uniref:Uncharacterized protein n=1 Tax=Dendrothele bispora (strain CBS 962.96) TaxID=1314807 RepID=A0A4S8MA27_DENBC|nr:hypothetical protein K435DRAFT_502959 [Dendrothele bispora CBS 962.96]